MDSELFALCQELGEQLTAAHWQLTTAESCTGGGLAAALTEVPGSSRWFGAGWVTYSNAAKSALLDVPADLLQGPGAPGAVSRETVIAMACGALDKAGANLALATSGIAGPGGGTADKPVGTVWIGWALRAPDSESVSSAAECHLFVGDRESVRRQTVHVALARLLDIVNNQLREGRPDR